jgi:hypothetical protein
MPYVYELRNRQRVKRALVSGVLLIFLFLLLVLAPARILGWTGLGFGSLTAPEATVAAVDEPVAMAVAKILTPPLLEPMTFPAYAEWSDIDAACGDCDGSFSYGIGGDLDPVDNEALSRLEHSSGVGPGNGAGSVYRTAGSSGGAASAGGLGGGGGAGSAAAGGAASSGEATDDTSAPASEDAESTAVAAAAAAASGPAAEGEGSPSGGDSSSGGSSAPEAVAADLILSRITPDDQGGPSSAGTLPQDVVQALVESPVGSETVHSSGEPEVISALLNLEESAAAGGDAGAQQQTVPEPMSLLLVGLGLSAGVFRLRRVAR